MVPGAPSEPTVSVFQSLRVVVQVLVGGFIQHLPDAGSLRQDGQSALVRGWVCLMPVRAVEVD
jgi:hypothetical protein